MLPSSQETMSTVPDGSISVQFILFGKASIISNITISLSTSVRILSMACLRLSMLSMHLQTAWKACAKRT